MIQHSITAKVHDDSLVLENMEASMWEQMKRTMKREHSVSFWAIQFIEKTTVFDEATGVWTCTMTWWQSEEPELFVKPDKSKPSQ